MMVHSITPDTFGSLSFLIWIFEFNLLPFFSLNLGFFPSSLWFHLFHLHGFQFFLLTLKNFFFCHLSFLIHLSVLTCYISQTQFLKILCCLQATMLQSFHFHSTEAAELAESCFSHFSYFQQSFRSSHLALSLQWTMYHHQCVCLPGAYADYTLCTHTLVKMFSNKSLF